eukprot:7257978-Pyramimonas_sp.AAC.1
MARAALGLDRLRSRLPRSLLPPRSMQEHQLTVLACSSTASSAPRPRPRGGRQRFVELRSGPAGGVEDF